MMDFSKSITIALGGGGAKGNAHIGVLRRLEQAGFVVRAAAGTSFGGLVAVFYALGNSPDKIEEIFNTFDQSRLHGHTVGDGPSLLGIEGGKIWLQDNLGDQTFADLKIPCALTATDLKSGSEVILTEGPLLDAVLATTAIPGIFPPRRIGDWELVDGGVLDPVPVAPARSLAPGLPVVAVSLNDPIGMPAQPWNIPIPSFMPQSLMLRISRSRVAQAVDVILRSFDIVSRGAAQYRLEVDRPDIIIRPIVADIDTLEQVDVSVVAKRGDEAVDAILPELNNLFAWRNRLRRAVGV
ncbi:MAG TPA: patatin-like phospholipase family protein [Anaerolineales bacterium]|nr:patatin-like phospholipase family protein [Anaerolineales bacterium]